VGIAHAVSKAADVVLLDPPFQPDVDIQDAVAIAYSVFGTMQRKILETEMHNVYFQSLARRAIARLTSEEFARASAGNKLLERFVRTLPVTDLSYIRPAQTLPVTVAGFADEEGIGKAYRTGWLDVERGFTPYDWSTFQL
jgi:hypothetical protein